MELCSEKLGQSCILVLGLGNPILGDDGIGWHVAEAVQHVLLARNPANQDVEIDCFALGGLSLMERLIGYDQAIIIDAIQSDTGISGEVTDLRLSDLPDLSVGHMTAAHDTSLQTALRLGRMMGASLPYEIRIVGIEADKVYDFSEKLSPVVEAAIPEAVQMVLNQLDQFQSRQIAMAAVDGPLEF